MKIFQVLKDKLKDFNCGSNFGNKYYQLMKHHKTQDIAIMTAFRGDYEELENELSEKMDKQYEIVKQEKSKSSMNNFRNKAFLQDLRKYRPDFFTKTIGGYGSEEETDIEGFENSSLIKEVKERYGTKVKNQELYYIYHIIKETEQDVKVVQKKLKEIKEKEEKRENGEKLSEEDKKQIDNKEELIEKEKTYNRLINFFRLFQKKNDNVFKFIRDVKKLFNYDDGSEKSFVIYMDKSRRKHFFSWLYEECKIYNQESFIFAPAGQKYVMMVFVNDCSWDSTYKAGDVLFLDKIKLADIGSGGFTRMSTQIIKMADFLDENGKHIVKKYDEVNKRYSKGLEALSGIFFV